MVFDKVRDIIVDQLSVDESMVAMDTNLMKDLEADSLDAVEIIMAIEEEYGIGFKKGNAELAEKVKQTLLEMKADGTVDQITEKWFGAKDSFVLE